MPPTTPRSSSGTWYRQPWPWLLMSGPAIVVVAALFTAWLAISTDDGLVANDYYKRGLLINKTLERQGRADALHLGANVAIAADGSVRVELSGEADGTAPRASVQLKLVHPTRAGHDIVVALERASDGSYRGRVASFAAGRWRVSVETDAWRLPSVESIAPGETRLGSERIAH